MAPMCLGRSSSLVASEVPPYMPCLVVPVKQTVTYQDFAGRAGL